MELDDLKNTWSEMSDQIKEKQNLNIKTFDKMSQKKIHSNLIKILLPEILGSAVCIAGAVYVAFNFYRLNGIAFQVVGIITILIFLILPIISLMSIQHLYKTGNVDQAYSDALKEFAVQKIKFCKLQKLNLLLSNLLLVCVIVLATRIFGRKEITDSKYFFVFAFSFGYIFLMFFSKWVSKSYNKTIKLTENLLSELAG